MEKAINNNFIIEIINLRASAIAGTSEQWFNEMGRKMNITHNKIRRLDERITNNKIMNNAFGGFINDLRANQRIQRASELLQREETNN